MLIWLNRRFASREESGYGLIMVIGMAAIVTMLMIVATTIADRALKSSSAHGAFENALAAAEDGIDQTLARAQKVYNIVGGDLYVTPSPSSESAQWNDTSPPCPQSMVDWPFSSPPTQAQEETWARTQLTALASTCLQTSPDGDFVTMKPNGHQAVYAMGWYPHFGANNVKTRLLKAEYLFTPYKPSNAILASGSLELDSSTKVQQVGSNCPPGPDLAAVHSNGQITVPSGNPTVCGPVSSSNNSSASSTKFYGNTCTDANGDPITNCTVDAVTQTATQTVPVISAAEVWGRNHQEYKDNWYDLCADGTVQAPLGSKPCDGASVMGDYSATGANHGTSFRGGWTYDANSGGTPRWVIGKNLASGIYYVDGADIYPATGNGNTSVYNATIIAAAEGTDCGNQVGGNISWDHNNLQAPLLPNLFMLADKDLMTTSNFQAGSMDTATGTVVSGFFIAGDQISLQTSSNGAYGAVIAADQCTTGSDTSLVTSDVVKNPSIYYDPNAQAPFVDIINTTLWLEMPGH